MSAEETLKLISKQWCSITDLMKLLGCGRNKALEVKKDIMEFVGPAYHWICWYFSVSEYQPISKV